MPELPEVETIVRRLRPRFIGQTVAGLWCNWPRMLTPGLAAMRRRIFGRSVSEVARRGKFIVLQLQNGAVQPGQSGTRRPEPNVWLLIHLRMSGRPLIVDARGNGPATKHVHLIVRFDSGVEFHLDDARKFARAVCTSDPHAALAGLGAEPMAEAFTPDVLAGLLRQRSRQLKALLLDQALVAGLGNIYTDEALHRAGLHPLRRSDTLKPDQVARLHAAIREVLAAGIRHNGASLDWVYPGGEMQDHFLAYGRTGEPCRQCGARITRLVVAQRGTHICPRCQRRPPE